MIVPLSRLEMKFLLAFLVSLILCQFSYGFTSEKLQVRIDDGKIIGRFMRSTSGRPIRAFLGIPFAAPPIGELRFKAPKPVEPWFNKILYAQKEPPKCSQVNFFEPKREDMVHQGQEDCLYLNVYTPDIKNKTQRLPVMVWIHGGAWILGQGGNTEYGPENFLDHDIILVSGNYRLGPLGFLSTEDDNASGNFGFKDQMAILEWVQQHISKFGGDRNSVTIFGESAGSVSVNYHMISPLSKGLFHRAISQSGTVMNGWTDPARKGFAKMRTIRLADMMGCPVSGTSMKEVVECLRKVPAEKLTMAQLDFHEIDNELVFDLVIFPPVVEQEHLEDEEPFLVDLRYRKHAHDIPWLLGITSDEGLFKSLRFLSSTKQKQLLTNNWEKLLPLTFFYDHLSEDDINEINTKIYNFYFKIDFLGSTEKNLTNMWMDGWFFGFFDTLEYRLRDNNRDNTFVYWLSHKGYASYTEILDKNFQGTDHGDDLLYLFPIPNSYVPNADWDLYLASFPSEEDEKVRRNMVKLWVNFARTGVPTPDWSTKSKFPYWTPASKFPLDYMSIGNENGNSKKLFKMKKGLYEERAKFWSDLKKQYNLISWEIDAKPSREKLDEKDEL